MESDNKEPYDTEQDKNIADQFLSSLCKEKIAVSIYLKSGICLKGTIEVFDSKCLYLKGVVNQLVYKQSICTILPDKMPEAEVELKSLN